MNPILPEKYQKNLVLASKSPRRIDLMKGLGFEFTVEPAGEEAERGITHENPFALAEVLARRKWEAISEKFPASLVIAADTVVILDGEILTKPANDDEAKRFIASLSGRSHDVVTGVAIGQRDRDVIISASERTRVTFRRLSDDEIDAYVATGEGKDKAGAYAAQGLGSFLIRKIEGCFYNVVGLPLSLLFDMMKRIDQ